MTGFKLSTEPLAGGSILTVDGELDLCSCPEVVREAHRQMDEHGNRLVLDLTPTTFMDVASLRLMEELHRSADRAGGALVVVLPRPPACRLLDLLPPREDLRLVARLAEARAAWRSDGLADTA